MADASVEERAREASVEDDEVELFTRRGQSLGPHGTSGDLMLGAPPGSSRGSR
jgi:hypothetical protein